ASALRGAHQRIARRPARIPLAADLASPLVVERVDLGEPALIDVDLERLHDARRRRGWVLVDQVVAGRQGDFECPVGLRPERLDEWEGSSPLRGRIPAMNPLKSDRRHREADDTSETAGLDASLDSG